MISEKEKFWLEQSRKEKVCDVHKIEQGLTENGGVVFSYVNGKWRDLFIETERFERNLERDKIREKAKDIL